MAGLRVRRSEVQPGHGGNLPDGFQAIVTNGGVYLRDT